MCWLAKERYHVMQTFVLMYDRRIRSILSRYLNWNFSLSLLPSLVTWYSSEWLGKYPWADGAELMCIIATCSVRFCVVNSRMRQRLPSRCPRYLVYHKRLFHERISDWAVCQRFLLLYKAWHVWGAYQLGRGPEHCTSDAELVEVRPLSTRRPSVFR